MDKTFEEKLKLLEQLTSRLDDTFSSLSERLLQAIVTEFADKLDREGDRVLNNSKNLRLIAAIENIYNAFSQDNLPEVASQIIDGADKISTHNVDYFGEFKGTRDYKATTQKVQKIIRDRLGITGKKTSLVPGGYMDSLLQDNSIKNELKNLSYREVMKETGFKDFKKSLETFIVGDEQKLGGFKQFYRNYAYDIFVDIDRQESTLIATNLDLKYFIYAGSLIKTSRPFCIARAGKVFSIKEAEKWINDPWIKSNLEKGYISSYDPVRDMGLWACRHTPKFISQEVADKMQNNS